MTNQNIAIPNHEVVYMSTPHGPQPVYPMNGVWTYEQILEHQKNIQKQQQQQQVDAKRQQERQLARKKLQIKLMQKQQQFLNQQHQQHYVQAIQQQQPTQHLQLQQVPIHFDANNKENCNRLTNQPISVISQNDTGATVSPLMNQSSLVMQVQPAISQYSSDIQVQTVINQQFVLQPVISQRDTSMVVQQSAYVPTELDSVVPMQQSCFVPSPSLLQQFQINTNTNDANYLPLSKNCADETTNSIPKWKLFWDSKEETIFRREHTRNISHQEAVYLDLAIFNTKSESIVKLQNVEPDFEDINIMDDFKPNFNNANPLIEPSQTNFNNTNPLIEPSQINGRSTPLPVKKATTVQVIGTTVDQEIKSTSNQSTKPSNTQPVRVSKNTKNHRITVQTCESNYTKEKTVPETHFHSKSYRAETSSKSNKTIATSKVNVEETNVFKSSVNSKTVRPKASSGPLKRSPIEQELHCQQMLSKKKKMNKKTKVIPKKQPKNVEKSKSEEKGSSLYVKLGRGDIKSKRLRETKLKTQRSDSLGSAVISPPDSPKYSKLRPSCNNGICPKNNDLHPEKDNLRPQDLSSANRDDDFDRNFFSVMQSFFLP